MKIKDCLLSALLFSLSSLSNAISPRMILAQVTPDGTTNTDVVSSDRQNFQIENGDRAGNNLFHSFENFSIPNGGSAVFNNTDAIENIFSRVTGGNISYLNGKLGTNGTTNLFLINPAGIMFGEGANLDVGGSFYGSTADSILFPEGEFNARDLDNPPLITINAPIGLNFRDTPNSISVDNTELISKSDINLIGGELLLNGGDIKGENIFLGGLVAAGKVMFVENNNFAFPDLVTKANILLNNSSLRIFQASENKIKLIANDLNLENNSRILVGTGNKISLTADNNLKLDNKSTIASQVSSATMSNAGDINLQAGGEIIIDNNSFISSQVNENGIGNTGNINLDALSISLANDSNIINIIRQGGEGNTGDINLNTNILLLNRDSQINTRTQGDGNAGNIKIDAPNGILLEDFSAIFSQTDESGNGNSGNIAIASDSISLIEQSKINSNTKGTGNAGDIRLSLTDNLELINRSSIQAQVLETAREARAGNIKIDARNISLNNKSFIIATTQGFGDAGNIDLTVSKNISLDNDSLINATVSDNAIGNSGTLKIDASKIFVLDSSIISASTAGIGSSGNVDIKGDLLVLKNFSLIASSSRKDISRNSGKIDIDVSEIEITEGSIINSSTSSDFSAGKINIKSDRLNINSGGAIQTATEAKGNAGDINLEIAETLIIDGRNPPARPQKFDFGENILNNLEGKTGIFANTNNFEFSDGGNINIDSKFVVAFPNSNSDIIASADRGMGGNININTWGIFGIAERKSFAENETNDLDASSQLGINGSISINSYNSDNLRPAIELSTNIIDSTIIEAKACLTDREVLATNNLVIRGKEYSRRQPIDPLLSERILNNKINISAFPKIQRIATARGNIILANGIIKTEDGRIILTARRPSSTAYRTSKNSQNCH